MRKNTRLPEGAGVLPTCLLTDSLANKKAIYDTIGFTPSFDGSSILGQMGCGDTLCSVPFLAEMLRVSSRFMLPLVVGRDGFGGTLAPCSCDREPCVAIGRLGFEAGSPVGCGYRFKGSTGQFSVGPGKPGSRDS